MKKDLDTRASGESVEKSRRNLLKAITAGGATAAVVPSEWTKPALKSVLLPAHAQTTGTGEDCVRYSAWGLGGRTSTRESFSMSVNGLLDDACGQGNGSIKVYRAGDKSPWLQCATSAGADAGWLPSFSCSWSAAQTFTSNIAAEGDQLTVIAEFDNGCSCVTTITVV